MSLEHSPEQAAPTARKMIRKSTLLELIPLSFPTLWAMIRRGEFPAPVKFGTAPNAPSFWFEDEVSEAQERMARAEYKPVAGAITP